MAESLDIGTLAGRVELEDKMSHTLDLINGKLEQFDHAAGGVGGRITEMITGFASAEAIVNLFESGVHLVVETLKELTIEGAAVADVSENFEHLTGSVNRSGEAMLGALREGTHNTITDFELMKVANKDLSAGLNLTDEQFKTMAKGAFALAQATGGDVAGGFEKMNEAMLRGNARSLRTLGIRIDQSAAEDKYAAQLGTTADRLTSEEKLEATRAAILEKVNERLQRLGEQTDGIDEFVEQLATAWHNFEEELGKTIATSPVIMAGLTGIKEALQGAFSGTQEELIASIVERIEDMAIGTMELAETVVDAVGVIGTEWHALLAVLDMVQGGWAAIAYVAEGALLLIEKAINAVSMGALDEQVKTLEADMERWYNTMAESQASIEGHKKAEEEWAITTGHVKDKIEEIRQGMISAKKDHAEHNEKISETAAEWNKAAKAGVDFAATEEHVAGATRMTKEEIEKMNEALKQMSEVGGNWHTTLNSIDGETVDAIKYYAEAGIELNKLQLAYGLTDLQIKAVEKSMKEEVETTKKSTEEKKKLEEALGRISLAGNGYKDVVNTVRDSVVSDIRAAMDQGAALSDLGVKYGLTALQVEALVRMFEKEKTAHAEAGAAATQHSATMNAFAGMTQTLTGEWIKLEEAKKRLAAGGSASYDLSTQQGMDFFMKQNPMAGFAAGFDPMEAAKKGMTIEQMIKQGLLNLYANWNGPRFAEGGEGDFGSGTLAMLHGKEVITPVDKLSGGGGMGGMVVNNYINGTAADVAKQVSDEIMRTVKTIHKFGSA